MGEAKERSDWNKASALIVKLHNVNMTKKADCIDFKDVHPYFISKQLAQQVEEVPEKLGELKRALE